MIVAAVTLDCVVKFVTSSIVVLVAEKGEIFNLLACQHAGGEIHSDDGFDRVRAFANIFMDVDLAVDNKDIVASIAPYKLTDRAAAIVEHIVAAPKCDIANERAMVDEYLGAGV